MNNLLQKRLAGLLCVKSIVTLIMAAVFAFSVLTDRISGEDFLTIFSVIIAFYFGTQSERLTGMLGKEQDGCARSAIPANRQRVRLRADPFSCVCKKREGGGKTSVIC